MLINHIHDRTMIYNRLLIESNQYDDLPKIDAHFERRECQPENSIGNRYHIHGGFNTKNMTCSELRKIICCDPNYLFSEQYGTSYPQLL